MGVQRRLAAIVAMTAAALAGTASAQVGGGGGGGFDVSAIRGMITQRIQQQLEIPDEDWKVIEPKVFKVMQLQVEAGGFAGQMQGLGRMMGNGQMNQIVMTIFGMSEPSAVMRRRDELQQALDNGASGPSVGEKLQALRDAVTKAKGELKAAQADLVQVLSLRQEAMLVQMGLLE